MDHPLSETRPKRLYPFTRKERGWRGPVSRILSSPRGEGWSFLLVPHRCRTLAAYPFRLAFGPRERATLCLTERQQGGGTYLALLRVGFAKPARHRAAGALLPHLFTLTPQAAPSEEENKWAADEAVSFLWHCPWGYPRWALPTTLPCGVRTFLSVLAIGATTRPPPAVSKYSGFSATWQGKNRPALPFEMEGNVDDNRPLVEVETGLDSEGGLIV